MVVQQKTCLSFLDNVPLLTIYIHKIMNFDPQNFGEFLDAYQHYISDRRQYQAGGDAQGGGSQQAFMQQAVQAIASGQADAHDVFVQLQKMGMKKEQAAGANMIQN